MRPPLLDGRRGRHASRSARRSRRPACCPRGSPDGRRPGGPGRPRDGEQPRDRRRGRGQGRVRGRDGRGPLPHGRRRGASGRSPGSARRAATARRSRPTSRTATRPRGSCERRSSASGGSTGSSTTPAGRRSAPFLELEPDEWDAVIATDLTAAYRTSPGRDPAHGRARRRLHRQRRVAARAGGRRPRPPRTARPRPGSSGSPGRSRWSSGRRASGSTPSRRASR